MRYFFYILLLLLSFIPIVGFIVVGSKIQLDYTTIFAISCTYILLIPGVIRNFKLIKLFFDRKKDEVPFFLASNEITFFIASFVLEIIAYIIIGKMTNENSNLWLFVFNAILIMLYIFYSEKTQVTKFLSYFLIISLSFLFISLIILVCMFVQSYYSSNYLPV
jgi:hypothetical protein